MSYDNEVVRICALQNGYEVECYEPKEAPKKVKANGEIVEPKAKTTEPYMPSWKAYAFPTAGALVAFLTKKLPSLTRQPALEFDEAFEEASKED